MAVALARSFRLWHEGSDIRFFLATDRSRAELPPDLSDLDLIPLDPGQYGTGFTPKLHLDHIAPSEDSLFVDADCLCVGSLVSAFDRFSGHSVSVIGRDISAGEWFGDIAAICGNFNVPGMPKFNGGVYYVKRGEACEKVYQTARALLPRYDEIGFRRLRGHPNDEVIISLAMALCGQVAIPDRGDIMNSLLAGPGGVKIDVFRGYAALRNPRRHPRYNDWYEQETMHPRIVHFVSAETGSYPYMREIKRLHLVHEHRWPVWLARAWTNVSVSLPKMTIKVSKHLLRPFYRALFGARRINASVRP
jgi:hypothetical protein